jgi:methionyl-tRNA synthetase
MKKPYYITTAIAYASGRPHIGNVYEIILADAIARFRRMQGYDVFFQTGTDEHGQKIAQKAKDAGVTPQAFVDSIQQDIESIFQLVDISYDKFIRTTDNEHQVRVQQIFERLIEQGDIYKGFYEGLYCVPDESFYSVSQLVDGKCPDCGRDVIPMKEEAYFFNLKKYQQRLIDHIQAHPEFIQPESRKNEMMKNFLEVGLEDLCVSRTSFDWGVKVTSDPSHVVYVWIDALSNYITGLGYDVDGNHADLFERYWPADVHLIGKDILRFHTIYWPSMLMALGIALPKQIFGHPWLLSAEGKMSKSVGNTLYTEDLVQLFGVDAVRYFVLRETPFAADGTISIEMMVERINTDLANTLGNLLHRTIAMVHQYFAGVIPVMTMIRPLDQEVHTLVVETAVQVERSMEKLKVSEAIQTIQATLRRTNKYIDETEPWKLIKQGEEDAAKTVLYTILETVRQMSVLLLSFMPTTAQTILNQLKTSHRDFASLDSFGYLESQHIEPGEPVYQRFDLEEVKAKFTSVQAPTRPTKPQITIDQFAALDLVVGKVLSCQKHPSADRLLVSQIDLGSGDVRQIVSGIAEHVTPEAFTGSHVAVVANLKPLSLRGVESHGMILAASAQGQLEVLVSKLPPGAKIS